MLPEWLDVSSDENAAAAKVRQLRTRAVSWGELVAGAQAIIGVYQDYPANDIVNLYDEKIALDLIASARILDAASQSDEIEASERTDLAVLAMVAFGMYGNSLSSSAVSQRLFGGSHEKTPSLAVVYATAAPKTLGTVLEWCEADSPEREYLETLGDYLRHGKRSDVPVLRKALADAMTNGQSPFERSLLLSCELCLEHIFVLGVASAIPPNWPDCPPEYIGRLVDAGVVLLLPPQYKAIATNGLLKSPGNALIALPTSAGKTLLGELCLLAALGDSPGLACYIAPYVALGRQVAESLKKHLPKRYKVHALVGGHQGEEKLDPTNNLEVVIATPERLDSLLRLRPELGQSIKCLVCDEAHMIQNGSRGVRLEGVIARIRMLQGQRVNCRIILVSAVLPDYIQLKAWLGITEANFVTDTWRPTARRIAIWRQDGKLVWYQGADPVRKRGVQNSHVLGVADVPWPKVRFYGSEHYGAIQKQEPDVFENIAYLINFLHRRFTGGPILCYCTSRHSTRRLASAIAARMEVLEPLPTTISSTIALIRSRHKTLRPLAEMLQRGVAYHNAALPDAVRTQIEEAVKQREIVAVTATTTLAEGVDLPFRFTVLSDWLAWEGDRQQPLQSLLFRNIAGRCGRAGEMTEGDTIIFDNPVGDPRYTDQYTRHGTITSLFIDPPAGVLRSALTRATSGSEDYEACHGELASQFMAAIPENAADDDLAKTFCSNLYSCLDEETAPRVQKSIRNIRQSLLDDSRIAVATAASPLHLTTFGRAALYTSLSPDSCRSIVACLRGEKPPEDTAGLSNHLLLNLGTLPEQPLGKVRKLLSGKKNSQFQVKLEDFAGLLKIWLVGTPLDEMFLTLPALARSKKSPKVNEWVSGLITPSVWDDDFDKFCDVIKNVFEGFLPRLMKACEALSPIAGGWSENVDWPTIAQYMEYGVDSEWAVAVLRAKIAHDRRSVAAVGRDIPDEWISETDPDGTKGIRKTPSRKREFVAICEKHLREARGDETELGREIIELRDQYLQCAGTPVIA